MIPSYKIHQVIEEYSKFIIRNKATDKNKNYYNNKNISNLLNKITQSILRKITKYGKDSKLSDTSTVNFENFTCEFQYKLIDENENEILKKTKIEP